MSQSPVSKKSRMELTDSTRVVAKDLEEFLLCPTLYAPRREFVDSTYFVDGDTVLIVCIRQRNEMAVAALCEAGVDVNLCNRKGVTPISAAAHGGQVEIMKHLIRSGALVNAVNASGSASLIQAAHFGHHEAVELLLDNDANPDFANSKGTTALMRAAQEGYDQICKMLLESRMGVHVNRKNYEGMNALMLGSQRGHAKAVKVLISFNAFMDERTSQGSTALMLACKRGHEEVVKVLISMGAEICVRDIHGRTASDTAIKYGHHQLLRWLNTQVQLDLIRGTKRLQRSADLLTMHNAAGMGRLRMSEEARVAVQVFKAERSSSSTDSSEGSPQTGSSSCSANSSVTQGEYCRRRPRYRDWHWIAVLQRAFALPDGVFDYIVEFMPPPRMYRWHFSRMWRRCELAPVVTAADLCVLMDELLADSCIVNSPKQSKLMIKLLRNPSMGQYLLDHDLIDSANLEELVEWSDVQSILHRTDPEQMDVIFRTSFVRRFFAVIVHVFKSMSKRGSLRHAIEIQSSQPVSGDSHPILDSMDVASMEDEECADGTWVVRVPSMTNGPLWSAGNGPSGLQHTMGGSSLESPGRGDMQRDSDEDSQNGGDGDSGRGFTHDVCSAWFSDDEEGVVLDPLEMLGVQQQYSVGSILDGEASVRRVTSSDEGLQSSAQYQAILQRSKFARGIVSKKT